eukprot:NODE_1376_length_885_cov_42.726913_g1330_i0.p1 GENE.NODE_1376_length_885_cov_42.726913_g1330_i0~~NODE_1376_length_885_cov_42.726913_g1330_i0.p1  ORF type:complete len:254 (+),score=84.06 NODE_1376_length_885_cov_42.726913_g1330_i0:3-764(+)
MYYYSPTPAVPATYAYPAYGYGASPYGAYGAYGAVVPAAPVAAAPSYYGGFGGYYYGAPTTGYMFPHPSPLAFQTTAVASPFAAAAASPSAAAAAASPSAAQPVDAADVEVSVPTEAADKGDNGQFSLEVYVDKANMKNADQLPDLNPIVYLELGEQKKESTRKMRTLTPEWEERFMFQVKDPDTQQLNVKVCLGGDEVGAGFLKLDKLIQGKSTYKGVAVKGGKLDMTLKAIDFGAEEKDEEEEGDWMDFMA